MSKLQAFLNKNKVTDITKEIVLSERFKDEEGKLLTFKIKPLSNAKFQELQKKYTKIDSKKEINFDIAGYNNALAIECTLDPNFKDASSIQDMGLNTPTEYIESCLLAGEIAILANKILEFSGFKENINDLIDESKN